MSKNFMTVEDKKDWKFSTWSEDDWSMDGFFLPSGKFWCDFYRPGWIRRHFYFPEHSRRLPRSQPPFKWTKLALKVFSAHVTVFAVLFLFCLPAHAAITGAQLDQLELKIIQAESSGDPSAVGRDGERGLMQITKETWDRLSSWPWRDAFDPLKNIQVGRRRLEEIANHYKDMATPARVAFSYNTGRYLRSAHIPAWARHHKNNIYRRIFNQ